MFPSRNRLEVKQELLEGGIHSRPLGPVRAQRDSEVSEGGWRCMYDR